MAPPPALLEALPAAVTDFVKTLLRSGLLDVPRLTDILRDLLRPLSASPEGMAEQLVRLGKLTRFQAAKLLKGVHKGLMLGDYQFLSLIGKGGMGAVYLARDQRNGQLVALKVLPPHLARAKPRLLARFRREMQISTRIIHPHIARTIQTDKKDGVNYIAMEFIPGRNLGRLVTDQGPLPVPRAARLMAEVASGLAHAHAQGLIHRDLKPSNILVTP